MSLESLEQEVINIIAEHLGEDKRDSIHAKMSFIGDLQIDSLDFVEIIMAVEERFGCTIPQDQNERIKTVGDLVAYIHEEQEKKKK